MSTARALFLLSIIIAIVVIPSGADAGWTENGAPVCTISGVQDQIKICSDDMGGSIIVWRDRRSTANIYAQRLDQMGRRLWAEAGVLVCGATDVQEWPEVLPDGSGGAYIVWQDFRGGMDFDIYAQRIDSDGAPLWTVDGVVICDAADFQISPVMCSASVGGFLVAWEDGRSGTSLDVYAQRVDSGGTSLLTADGVAICGATGDQTEVDIVSDDNSGAFIVWQDQRGDTRIYGQRMYSNGAIAFTADGIGIFDSTYDQYGPKAAIDGVGGVYVVMYDSMYRAYIQRFGVDGVMRFGASGAILGYNSPYYALPLIMEDGIGGAIIAWQSWRTDGTTRYDLYVQRVNRTGTLLWGLDGIPVCTYGASVYNLSLTSDGQRGLVISWRDTRDIATTVNDLYVQRVDSLGSMRWALNGEPICIQEDNQTIPVMTTDGSGGAIIAWQDSRNGDLDTYAMRILSDGDYIATALAGFIAVPAVEGVGIEWTMSRMDPGVSFRILRALSVTEYQDAGSLFFEEIAIITADMDEMEYSFLDTDAESGRNYVYRVEVVMGGTGPDEETHILFETEPVGLPSAALTLGQNVPNPFNPVTRISFYLPSRAQARLDIFDVSGRHIMRLIDETRGPGEGEVVWNGMNTGGEMVSSGIYFYRLSAGKETLTRKMILLR
ncbi:MAG: T9SS type A sorting domain-containing protein [Bacteroidales bacterium]|nr:T9SS type A sorting domain-containing protein [Candidatus Latescibacterota bacterium]